jgi:hypothetical protein
MPKHTRKKKHIHHRKKHSAIAKWWRNFQYRHTAVAVSAIILFIIVFDSAIVQTALDEIHTLHYLGVIIGGALYTSLFTTAPGIAILLSFSDMYSPLTIALVGAVGSVIGDWIILKVFEERIGYELTPLVKKFHLKGFFKRLKRKKARDRTILLGMFAIGSPLPDEVGIGLLGIAHLPVVSLLIITYLLNAAGLLLLVYGVTLF